MTNWNEYWSGRWQRGETGWHQAEVEPALIDYFSAQTGLRGVLVPLCGKSLDLSWLASRGFHVLGVELSETACRSFFEEHAMKPEFSRQDSFQVFSHGNLTLLQGDFFELNKEHLRGLGFHLDAIYDRAALIAVPPELRERYAKKLLNLVRTLAEPERFRMLQILLERTPHDTQGPPFSIPTAELEGHYRPFLQIRAISAEPVQARTFTESQTTERVFELRFPIH